MTSTVSVSASGWTIDLNVCDLPSLSCIFTSKALSHSACEGKGEADGGKLSDVDAIAIGLAGGLVAFAFELFLRTAMAQRREGRNKRQMRRFMGYDHISSRNICLSILQRHGAYDAGGGGPDKLSCLRFFVETGPACFRNRHSNFPSPPKQVLLIAPRSNQMT
jgi:hypothetical protein